MTGLWGTFATTSTSGLATYQQATGNPVSVARCIRQLGHDLGTADAQGGEHVPGPHVPPLPEGPLHAGHGAHAQATHATVQHGDQAWLRRRCDVHVPYPLLLRTQPGPQRKPVLKGPILYSAGCWFATLPDALCKEPNKETAAAHAHNGGEQHADPKLPRRVAVEEQLDKVAKEHGEAEAEEEQDKLSHVQRALHERDQALAAGPGVGTALGRPPHPQAGRGPDQRPVENALERVQNAGRAHAHGRQHLHGAHDLFVT